ncbi:DUF1761 domain-containing protein [Microbacterium tumbae]
MDVNILAVALAALIAFFGGFVWYTIAFARPWRRLIGMGEKEAETDVRPPNLGVLLISSLVIEIAMALVLAWLIGAEATAVDGLIAGLVIGLGIVAASFAVIFLYEGRPVRLWLIHAGFYTVVFGLMGLVIGAF